MAQQPEATQKSGGFRWVGFLIVLALCGVILALPSLLVDVLGGMDAFASFLAPIVCGMLVVGWLVLASGLSILARLGVAALGVVAAGVLVSALTPYPLIWRVDGYQGDMVPDVAWAWSPTKEQIRLSYAAAEGSASEKASGIDLTPTTDGDYPGFLGADRRAYLPQTKLATDWSGDAVKELWRHPVGLGWGGFAAVGDYAITQEQHEQAEAVVCYNITTGKPVWTHSDPIRFEDSTTLGGDGPRATPVIHEGKVYTLGGTGLLNCLDGATGQALWSTNILEDSGANNIRWGVSHSPLVFDDQVVVCPGGHNGTGALISYDKNSGEIRWKANTGDRAAYASPMITTLAGVRQILILNGPGLSSFDPETGKQLWQFGWVVNDPELINTTQPMVLADWGYPADDGRVFISSGYGKGCALTNVSQTDGQFEVQELWANRNLRSKFANMLIRDGHVYGLDEGFLTCLDLETGERVWKKSRAAHFGHGQMVGLGDDLILVQAESPGNVVLVRATPEGFTELGRLPGVERKTWNSPALAGNRLLVRNDAEAVCYELPLAK